MVFQDGVDVEFLCEAEGSGYAHMEMGEPYVNLIRRKHAGMEDIIKKAEADPRSCRTNFTFLPLRLMKRIPIRSL